MRALQGTVSVLMTAECQAGTWQWALEAGNKRLTAELLVMKKKTCVQLKGNLWRKVETGSQEYTDSKTSRTSAMNLKR